MVGFDQEVVVLRCFDGAEFGVPTEMARRSRVVAAAMETEEYAETGVVRVPGVAGGALGMVFLYWFTRVTATAYGVDPAEFDEEYVAGLSHDMRVDMIRAAHDLDEQQLFEALRSHVTRVYNVYRLKLLPHLQCRPTRLYP